VRFSKIIVVLIVILNIAFTLGIMAVFWHTGAEPTSLIVSWFAFTTGELGLNAFVKIGKLRHEHGNVVEYSDSSIGADYPNSDVEKGLPQTGEADSAGVGYSGGESVG
jgi:hypothetical protein